MESTTFDLKWFCFFWTVRRAPDLEHKVSSLHRNERPFERLTGDTPPNAPGCLPDGSSGEQRATHEATTKAYMKAVADTQNCNNTLWCHIAMVLDSTRLMLIRHDCVDNKGLGGGRKARVLLQQGFRSEETMKVVSVMSQLACLQLEEDEALHN